MHDMPIVPNVTQTFYDRIASQYDRFYQDWDETVRSEARFLQNLFAEFGFDASARILDCACGIGTQVIGLAALGYDVTGSDLSAGALAEARHRAAERKVNIRFKQADFRVLSGVFSESFDVVIAVDNALPHMLSADDLALAIRSIVGRLRKGGLFIASIRDYDLMLAEKPDHSAPYVHKTEQGQRVLFQTWNWHGENYQFIQYIIDDAETLSVSKFECEYRAVRRAELSAHLHQAGCREVLWRMPEETGFYQPIVIARK